MSSRATKKRNRGSLLGKTWASGFAPGHDVAKVTEVINGVVHYHYVEGAWTGDDTLAESVFRMRFPILWSYDHNDPEFSEHGWPDPDRIARLN